MNTMKLPISDLEYLSVGLPDEVKMYHFSGDFAGEIAAIDRWLTRPVPVPACLRKRLEIQRIFAVQLGFTIEAGLGENPLPVEQFDEIYRRNIGILVTAALGLPA